MLDIFLVIGLILLLRIGQDTLVLAKIDAFNQGNVCYSMAINFIEAMYGITVIKIILDLTDLSPWYVIAFGGGSLLGGPVSGTLKKRLDRKRVIQLKEILRDRKGKHVTILRADEVYLLK